MGGCAGKGFTSQERVKNLNTETEQLQIPSQGSPHLKMMSEGEAFLGATTSGDEEDVIALPRMHKELSPTRTISADSAEGSQGSRAEPRRPPPFGAPSSRRSNASTHGVFETPRRQESTKTRSRASLQRISLQHGDIMGEVDDEKPRSKGRGGPIPTPRETRASSLRRANSLAIARQAEKEMLARQAKQAQQRTTTTRNSRREDDVEQKHQQAQQSKEKNASVKPAVSASMQSTSISSAASSGESVSAEEQTPSSGPSMNVNTSRRGEEAMGKESKRCDGIPDTDEANRANAKVEVDTRATPMVEQINVAPLTAASLTRDLSSSPRPSASTSSSSGRGPPSYLVRRHLVDSGRHTPRGTTTSTATSSSRMEKKSSVSIPAKRAVQKQKASANRTVAASPSSPADILRDHLQLREATRRTSSTLKDQPIGNAPRLRSAPPLEQLALSGTPRNQLSTNTEQEMLLQKDVEERVILEPTSSIASETILNFNIDAADEEPLPQILLADLGLSKDREVDFLGGDIGDAGFIRDETESEQEEFFSNTTGSTAAATKMASNNPGKSIQISSRSGAGAPARAKAFGGPSLLSTPRNRTSAYKDPPPTTPRRAPDGTTNKSQQQSKSTRALRISKSTLASANMNRSSGAVSVKGNQGQAHIVGDHQNILVFDTAEPDRVADELSKSRDETRTRRSASVASTTRRATAPAPTSSSSQTTTQPARSTTTLAPTKRASTPSKVGRSRQNASSASPASSNGVEPSAGPIVISYTGGGGGVYQPHGVGGMIHQSPMGMPNIYNRGNATPGAVGVVTAVSSGGQANDITRQMFDKNTLRLMPQWAPLFCAVLDRIRAIGLENYMREQHQKCILQVIQRASGDKETACFLMEQHEQSDVQQNCGGAPPRVSRSSRASGTSSRSSGVSVVRGSSNHGTPTPGTGSSTGAYSSESYGNGGNGLGQSSTGVGMGGSKPYQNVRFTTFCRKRPIFNKELENGEYDCIQMVKGRPSATPSTGSTTSSKTVTKGYVCASVCSFEADLKTPFVQHHGYVFDHAFDETSSNKDVFRSVKENGFLRFAPGSIATLFMLGQTGSGKTYTMTALEARAADCIFKAKTNCQLSFVELRAGKVYDLLYKGRGFVDKSSRRNEVQLREVSSGVYELQGAESRQCNTALELQNWMKTGHDRRHTEATRANEAGSSRSHAVITITMSDCKLILVDAAGTERSKDTFRHCKQRQDETADINASLYSLKEIIRHRSAKPTEPIPTHLFRQSTLTKILAESFQAAPFLGGTGGASKEDLHNMHANSNGTGHSRMSSSSTSSTSFLAKSKSSSSMSASAERLSQFLATLGHNNGNISSPSCSGSSKNKLKVNKSSSSVLYFNGSPNPQSPQPTFTSPNLTTAPSRTSYGATLPEGPPENLIGVFCTVSPSCTDVEHTLTTLRTGYGMVPFVPPQTNTNNNSFSCGAPSCYVCGASSGGSSIEHHGRELGGPFASLLAGSSGGTGAFGGGPQGNQTQMMENINTQSTQLPSSAQLSALHTQHTHCVKQADLRRFIGDIQVRYVPVNKWSPQHVEQWFKQRISISEGPPPPTPMTPRGSPVFQPTPRTTTYGEDTSSSTVTSMMMLRGEQQQQEMSLAAANGMQVSNEGGSQMTTSSSSSAPVGKLPGGTTGAMLQRYPLTRFIQLFGKEVGQKVFSDLRREMDTPQFVPVAVG
ncbi:unnamed protein product [Amoebophrya sp. A25]|nr:unnamed protein product [Amoebophrya sp. A25]|eukprot:GSA25T00010215001.1